jgi:hypothetical protein
MAVRRLVLWDFDAALASPGNPAPPSLSAHGIRAIRLLVRSSSHADSDESVSIEQAAFTAGPVDIARAALQAHSLDQAITTLRHVSSDGAGETIALLIDELSPTTKTDVVLIFERQHPDPLWTQVSQGISTFVACVARTP